MRAKLKTINLGDLLNAPAWVVMSKLEPCSTDLVKSLPPLDQFEMAAKLEKVFKEHRPEAKM